MQYVRILWNAFLSSGGDKSVFITMIDREHVQWSSYRHGRLCKPEKENRNVAGNAPLS